MASLSILTQRMVSSREGVVNFYSFPNLVGTFHGIIDSITRHHYGGLVFKLGVGCFVGFVFFLFFSFFFVVVDFCVVVLIVFLFFLPFSFR